MYRVARVPRCKALEMFCKLRVSVLIINNRIWTHPWSGFNTNSTGVNGWMKENMELECEMREWNK